MGTDHHTDTHDHAHAPGAADHKDHDHPHHEGHDHPHHDHPHHDDHGHAHDGNHAHDHGSESLWQRLRHQAGHFLTPHSHDSADKVDSAMESSREGMRALWISLVALGITAVLQVVIVVISGSVALLGDTMHNFADALTAVPLGIAFILGRRVATRRYTYGFGRAEDIAGILIVLTIAGSAAFAGYEAISRLIEPADVTHLPWVAAAGFIGFVGNELVARYRITVGRRIGSAALVADGLHARTDGYTSLAVLASAGGVALGWQWADPVVGLFITLAILLVLKDAAREVYRRLMDAVDPSTVDKAEAVLAATPGVRGVARIRMRWIGHQLHAETDIVVDNELTVVQAHAIAVEAEHRLLHEVARLTAVTVHTDPAEAHSHEELAHHR